MELKIKNFSEENIIKNPKGKVHLNDFSYNPNYSELKKTKNVADEVKNTFYYIDKDGRKYIKLEKEGEKQLFISRLLKGIIPIADVFEKDGRYFSKVTDKEIKKFKTRKFESLLLDKYFLDIVFSDRDHSIRGEHNVLTRKKNGVPDAVIFFDFDLAEIGGEFLTYYLKNKEVDIKILRKKIKLLEDRVSDLIFWNSINPGFSKEEMVNIRKKMLREIRWLKILMYQESFVRYINNIKKNISKKIWK